MEVSTAVHANLMGIHRPHVHGTAMVLVLRGYSWHFPGGFKALWVFMGFSWHLTCVFMRLHALLPLPPHGQCYLLYVLCSTAKCIFMDDTWYQAPAVGM